MEVKDIIKKRRLELGLSYQQLGDLCEVDKTTVRKWELGLTENMKRDKLVKLSKAIDISPLVLLGLESYAEGESHAADEIAVYVLDTLFEEAIGLIPNPYPHLKPSDLFAIKLEIPYLLSDTMYGIFIRQDTAKNDDTVVANHMIKRFYHFNDITVLRALDSDEALTYVGDQARDILISGKLVGVVSPQIQ